MKKITLLLFILIGFNACKSDEPVVADFDFQETTNGEVFFTNRSSGATSYEWDFGGGKTSTELNPKFTFSDNKDFTILLSAKGKSGQNQKSKTLKISTSPDWAANFAKSYSAVYWIVGGYAIEKNIKNINTAQRSYILPPFSISRVDKNTITISKLDFPGFPAELKSLKLVSENSFVIDETITYADGAKYKYTGTGKLVGKSLTIYFERDSGFFFDKVQINATIL